MKGFYALLPMWAVLGFASAPTVTDPGAAGGGGADSGTGGAGSGTPAGGAGGTGAAPSAPAIDWKTAPAQFREAFDAQKRAFEDLQKKYDPYSKLGDPAQVQSFQSGYQQVYGEIKGVADALEIPEQEVADAIRTYGLVKVLDYLRGEYDQATKASEGDQQAQFERDLQDRIQQGIEQAISPIQQRENTRMTTEANALVERTIHQMATETFSKQGLDFAKAPEAFRDFVMTGVTEALKYDDEGLYALKFEGKSAPVQKAFQTFMSMFDAAYLARRQMETGARPAAPRGQQQPNKAPGQPKLDEILDNPDVIRTSQGRPAYST